MCTAGGDAAMPPGPERRLLPSAPGAGAAALGSGPCCVGSKKRLKEPQHGKTTEGDRALQEASMTAPKNFSMTALQDYRKTA
eukprot:1158895-Pelagomonas_calceolata.AAC.7